VKLNDLDVGEICFTYFTTTHDLTAEYPAYAARRLGWLDVPLLCGHDMDVRLPNPRGIPMCIRVLVLYNTPRPQSSIHFAYMRGADAIKAVTGTQPRYLRPPDWIIPDDARHDLERQGYQLLTISSENPVALRDVNSLDYLCAGRNPSGCPKPSLTGGVLKQIEQREKHGVYTHILAFHELSTTVAVMPELISELKARGYRFVTLSEYMRIVAGKR